MELWTYIILTFAGALSVFVIIGLGIEFGSQWMGRQVQTGGKYSALIEKIFRI